MWSKILLDHLYMMWYSHIKYLLQQFLKRRHQIEPYMYLSENFTNPYFFWDALYDLAKGGRGYWINIPSATRFSLWRCEEAHEGMISPRGVGDIESMFQVPRDFLFDDVRKLTRVWSRRGGGVNNRRNVPGSTRFSLWQCEEAHEGMISPRG